MRQYLNAQTWLQTSLVLLYGLHNFSTTRSAMILRKLRLYLETFLAMHFLNKGSVSKERPYMLKKAFLMKYLE